MNKFLKIPPKSPPFPQKISCEYFTIQTHSFRIVTQLRHYSEDRISVAFPLSRQLKDFPDTVLGLSIFFSGTFHGHFGDFWDFGTFGTLDFLWTKWIPLTFPYSLAYSLIPHSAIFGLLRYILGFLWNVWKD